jgi:hypothetical protein
MRPASSRDGCLGVTSDGSLNASFNASFDKRQSFALVTKDRELPAVLPDGWPRLLSIHQ